MGRQTAHRSVRGALLPCLMVLIMAVPSHVALGQRSDAPDRGGLGSLLSRPLPGSEARADADAAAALEEALTGFEGIDACRVILSRESSPSSHPPRRAAVQVTLTEDFEPTLPWLDGIVSFAQQAVPGLDARQLTIVDSTGRTLYAGGDFVALATPAPPPPEEDVAPGLDPGLLIAAGLLACSLVVLLVALRSRPSPADESPSPPGPFAFVASLDNDELEALLADERSEVAAVVARHCPEEDRRRVRRAAGLAEQPEGQRRDADPEAVSALAEALHRKLVSG